MDIRRWFGEPNYTEKTENKYGEENKIEIKLSECDQNVEDNTKMYRIKVFTDGSALRNGQPGCKYGGVGVFFGKEDPRNISKGIIKLGITNNQCEMIAVYLAIRTLKHCEKEITRCHIQIYSDSEYTINVITKWAPTWKKNGWKKKGGEIKNLKIIQSILEELKGLRYEFKHIKAHTKPKYHTGEHFDNWYGNHMADLFAHSSAQKVKKSTS